MGTSGCGRAWGALPRLLLLLLGASLLLVALAVPRGLAHSTSTSGSAPHDCNTPPKPVRRFFSRSLPAWQDPFRKYRISYYERVLRGEIPAAPTLPPLFETDDGHDSEAASRQPSGSGGSASGARPDSGPRPPAPAPEKPRAPAPCPLLIACSACTPSMMEHPQCMPTGYVSSYDCPTGLVLRPCEKPGKFRRVSYIVFLLVAGVGFLLALAFLRIRRRKHRSALDRVMKL
ncbi:hypothetical protein H696_01403 [Fonticula alba]|uniref:Uncharacterized protein n=1 Tax=Fonticula alba TaxID=691883 RepID=A0A058ZDH5_FONAL|nr:hypothetical protein H696_01403 [Fonticula alba]KCV71996.1 hypothetical protein H696_01403 [Fonticula alba]|eukprot:XP_009493574.1 hypothetical protein H696_01403 [Fonticula alba]